MQSSTRNPRARGSQRPRRVAETEVETICPKPGCGWREHVSASLTYLAACPLCGTSMQVAQVCDCCGTTCERFATVHFVVCGDDAYDRLAPPSPVAYHYRDVRLCVICIMDAQASFRRLCERLTGFRVAREGVESMGGQAVSFAYSIEARVVVIASGLKGTVIGLWIDRDAVKWLRVEQVLATQEIVTIWIRERHVEPAPLQQADAAPAPQADPEPRTESGGDTSEDKRAGDVPACDASG